MSALAPSGSRIDSYRAARSRVERASFLAVSLGGNAMTPDNDPLNIVGDRARKQVEDLMSSVLSLPMGISSSHPSHKGLLFTHGNGKIVGLCRQSLELRGKNPTTAATIRESQDVMAAALSRQVGRQMHKVALVNNTRVIVEPKKDGELPTKEVDAWFEFDDLAQEAANIQHINNEVVLIDGVYYAKSSDGERVRKLVWSPKLPHEGAVYEPDLSEVLEFVQHGVVPIAVGGGGIPISLNDKGEAMEVKEEAVVDKDMATARLLYQLLQQADAVSELRELLSNLVLYVVTAAHGVVEGFNGSNPRTIQHMSVRDVRDFLRESTHLGGMKPKLEQAAWLAERGIPVVIAEREDLKHGKDFSRRTIIHDGRTAL